MASNLVTFKSLMAQHVEDGKMVVPCEIKDNTSLGLAFSRLVTSEQPREGETRGATVSRYIDEICALLSNEENGEAVKCFDETVDAFTSKIRNAWSTIDGIRDISRELVKQMELFTDARLQEDKFVASHLNYSKLNTDFPVFEWNGTKILGSMTDVVRRVNALVTAKDVQPSDQIQRSLFDLVVSDMSRYGKTDDVEVTEEGRKAAIDMLSEVCQNAPAGDIEIAIDALTGIDKNCPVWNRLDQLKNIGWAQTNLVENVKAFDAFITSFYPIMDLVASEQIVPVPTAKDILIANAKSIMQVCEIAAYYEMMQRTSLLKEAVLMQGGLINGDNQEEFKKNGGTAKMIAEFIRFMYKDDTKQIPVAGIKGKVIIDGAINVADAVNKDIANVESKLTLARNTARMSALRVVMRDHIAKMLKRKNPDLTPTDVSTKTEEYMVKVVAPLAETLRQYKVNFMDITMNAIVGIEYPGSFVEQIFKELGAAYISATEMNGNVTAADLRQADVSVIAHLICEFLVDNLIVFHDVRDGTTPPAE